MNKLIRCTFCNKVIPIKELGLKDKDLGVLCKSCYDWITGEFHQIYVEVFSCL